MRDTCKRHVAGDRCGECGHGRELPAVLWFRALPRAARWIVGAPLVSAGLLAWHAETSRVPEPGDPQLAFWVQLILLVVSIVLTELLRPKPNIEDARPSGLGDFQFPTATEGRPVPLVWGKVRQRGPNVVWYGDLTTETITERVKTGLWSKETITIGFRYLVGVQMVICRGGTLTDPVVLRKIWVGDDLVLLPNLSTESNASYSNPTQYGGNKNGNGGLAFTIDYFPGTDTQSVSVWLDDPARQRLAGATTIPRYTGNCYVVARENTGGSATTADKGMYIGNSSSIVKPWSFEVERYPALFVGQNSGENKIGVDANPMNVVYEILTNTEWGMGEPASKIDANGAATGTFNLAALELDDEGLGFSMLLDGQRPAKDLLEELKRHIDGVVYVDHSTGKWTVQLARGEGVGRFQYDIDTVPQLTDSNVSQVRDFTRSAWVDTTNTITVQFDKRADDYKESYAVAIDTANAIIQGDQTVSGAQTTTGSLVFPGVKDSDVAAILAWRELRGQSYPLARCQFVVNRQMWDLNIGDVVAWTSTQFGFVKLPMRITEINYGRLEDNKMILTVVQDVFEFAQASMGSPPPTGWIPPTSEVGEYAATEQLAFESPRAILVRDPDFAGDENVSKVWCGGIQDTNATGFVITQRNDAGEPGGTYADDVTVYAFMRIGELNASLSAGDPNDGTTTITVEPADSTQAEIEEAFDDSTTLSDMGTSLSHLCYIADNDDDGEFVLVKSASNNGGNVDLEGVRRGVLDTPQMDHPSGRGVSLVHVGGGLTDTNFPTTNQVDVQLEQVSAYDRGDPGPEIDLQMAQRSIRPYPPSAPFYNGISQTLANSYGTPDLEDSTTGGENGYQFAVDWWRRSYDNADEIVALGADVDPDGGPVSNTEYQVRVFVDPDGGNTEIASSPLGWASGAGTVQVPRLEIIDAMTADDQEILVEIEARHDYSGVSTQIRGRYDLTHQVNPTSVNDGLFFLGGDIGNAASHAYPVPAGDDGETHTIQIGTTMTLANAEYRINGGSWVAIVGTSATTAALNTGDTIEVRVDASSYAPDPNFVWIEEGSSTRVAYGTL